MWHTDHQCVITGISENERIRILANPITYSGEVVSRSQYYRQQKSSMREIERDYGLQAVKQSRTAELRVPTKGEVEQGIRTGQPAARL